jgi:hypothetical protein
MRFDDGNGKLEKDSAYHDRAGKTQTAGVHKKLASDSLKEKVGGNEYNMKRTLAKIK